MLLTSHPSLRAVCGTAGRHQLQFGVKKGEVSLLILREHLCVTQWLNQHPCSGSLDLNMEQKRLSNLFFLLTIRKETSWHPYLFAFVSLFKYPSPALGLTSSCSTPTYFVFLMGSLSAFFFPTPPFLVLIYSDRIRNSVLYLPLLSNVPFLFQQWHSKYQTIHFLCEAWSNRTLCTQITRDGWWNTKQLSVQDD